MFPSPHRLVCSGRFFGQNFADFENADQVVPNQFDRPESQAIPQPAETVVKVIPVNSGQADLEFVGGNSLFGETGRIATVKMKIDERKDSHQTMSLFGDEPRVKPQAVFTTGRVEIFFDGGCLGNPGQKYGSFQVLFDGKQVVGRDRVQFGHGTNNEAEFNSLKLALDETVGWLQANGLDLKMLSLVVETDSMIVRNRLVKKNVIFKKYPSSQRMFALATECLEVMNQFGNFDVVWKGRAKNVERFGH